MRISKILAAVDFSEASDEALRVASDWAARWSAKLLACHVVPELLRSEPLFPQLNRSLSEELPVFLRGAEAAVSQRVREVTQLEPSQFSVVVTEGSPQVGLLDQARGLEVDLIVLGSVGHGAAEQWLQGSVSEQVVRGAHCPVLVVRASAQSDRVLAATDLSAASLPALEAAAEVARRLSAQLTLAHAIRVEVPLANRLGLMAGGPVWPIQENEKATLRQLVQDQLKGLLTQVGSAGTVLILEGSAGPEVVRAARELSTKLVVVGTFGRTGISRLLLGSVAARIVRTSPCSVLVVRDRARTGT